MAPTIGGVETHLESVPGHGVILVVAGPGLAPPSRPVKADPKHVHIEEDVFVVRDVQLAKLDHQLPEDVGRAAHKHDWEEEEEWGTRQEVMY